MHGNKFGDREDKATILPNLKDLQTANFNVKLKMTYKTVGILS